MITTADHGTIRGFHVDHVVVDGKKFMSFDDMGVNLSGVNLSDATIDGHPALRHPGTFEFCDIPGMTTRIDSDFPRYAIAATPQAQPHCKWVDAKTVERLKATPC
ncbi:MAG: hypothetical protein ACRD3N_17805 [Terracidiphilus sp.]